MSEPLDLDATISWCDVIEKIEQSKDIDSDALPLVLIDGIRTLVKRVRELEGRLGTRGELWGEPEDKSDAAPPKRPDYEAMLATYDHSDDIVDDPYYDEMPVTRLRIKNASTDIRMLVAGLQRAERIIDGQDYQLGEVMNHEPDPPTCETCKHWRDPVKLPFVTEGTCEKSVLIMEILPTFNFGCTLHEPRNETEADDE